MKPMEADACGKGPADLRISFFCLFLHIIRKRLKEFLFRNGSAYISLKAQGVALRTHKGRVP